MTEVFLCQITLWVNKNIHFPIKGTQIHTVVSKSFLKEEKKTDVQLPAYFPVIKTLEFAENANVPLPCLIYVLTFLWACFCVFCRCCYFMTRITVSIMNIQYHWIRFRRTAAQKGMSLYTCGHTQGGKTVTLCVEEVNKINIQGEGKNVSRKTQKSVL